MYGKEIAKILVSREDIAKRVKELAELINRDYAGKPLLVVVAECCPKAYLDYLAGKGISWVAAGKEYIDLRRAMELVACHFGVRRISLVGGGHVNGAFLAAGLLDEVSVMVGSGIDGRRGMTAIFDGIADPQAEPVLLDLRDVQRVGNDTVWLRYTVRQ